jgi:hypothetical protein
MSILHSMICSPHHERKLLMNHWVSVAAKSMVVLISSMALNVMAGRPLSTDDAGTADAKSCQVESWVEKQDKESAWVISPACGLVDGIELGFEYVRPETRDEIKAEAGLALKWVPASWQTSTAWGDLNFGLKFATGHAKPVGSGWRPVERGALLLATLVPNDRWTVHGNVGGVYDRESRTTGTVLNVATTYTPSNEWLVFGEVQANNKHDVFGKTVTSSGVRYWLVGDQLGVDVTASHQQGVPTLWTVGFGWYGLFK